MADLRRNHRPDWVGIRNGTRRLVQIVRPTLPPFLERVELRNLSTGTARLDLVLDRHQNEVAVTVTRRTHQVEVVLIV